MCAVIALTGLGAGFILLVAQLFGPAFAGRVLESSLAAAGFQGATTEVVVTSDPPWEVLGGRADRVQIDATDATIDQLAAERLSLVLLDSALPDRPFAMIEGQLEGVTLQAADGATIRAASIDVTGTPGDVRAVIRVDAAEVERLAAAELERETGIGGATASLEEPDRLAFTYLVFRIDNRFEVQPDGSLSLAVGLPGAPIVPLIADPAIRFDAVRVTGGQLVLEGRLDLPALAGG